MTADEADISRMVTRVRHIVERNFGRLKKTFRILDGRVDHKYLAKNSLNKMYRIIASISNAFFSKLSEDSVNDLLDLQTIQNRDVDGKKQFVNAIQTNSYNTGWKKASFEKLVESNLVPEFSLKDIRQFQCGTWGLELSKPYLNNCNDFTFYTHKKHANAIKIKGIKSKHKNQSRTVHLSFNTHKTIPSYLMNANCTIEWDDLGYKIENPKINDLTGNLGNLYSFCSCIQGKRTVGGCAHIIAVLTQFALKFLDCNIQKVTENSEIQNNILQSVTDITPNPKKRKLNNSQTNNEIPKKKNKNVTPKIQLRKKRNKTWNLKNNKKITHKI